MGFFHAKQPAKRDQATLEKVEKVGTKVGVSWQDDKSQVKRGSCDFVLWRVAVNMGIWGGDFWKHFREQQLISVVKH